MPSDVELQPLSKPMSNPFSRLIERAGDVPAHSMRTTPQRHGRYQHLCDCGCEAPPVLAGKPQRRSKHRPVLAWRARLAR